MWRLGIRNDRRRPPSAVRRHKETGMSMSARAPVEMDKIVSLCKRRGFVFPAAEIYGGFANAWDYGPLGVEMRRNIRNAWWQAIVRERDDVVGLEATVITNPAV